MQVFLKSVADSQFSLSGFQRTDAFFRRELLSYVRFEVAVKPLTRFARRTTTDALKVFPVWARPVCVCLVKEPARMGRRSARDRREGRSVQPLADPVKGLFSSSSVSFLALYRLEPLGGELRRSREHGAGHLKITFRQRPTLPHTGRVQYHRR